MNEDQLTEELWEKVLLKYPEVSNAEFHATKVGNKEFAEVCNKFLHDKLKEEFNNIPDASDTADLQISSDETK